MENIIEYTLSLKNYNKLTKYIQEKKKILLLKISPNDIIEIYDCRENAYDLNSEEHVEIIIKISVEDLMRLHNFLIDKNLSGYIHRRSIWNLNKIILKNNYIDILDYWIFGNCLFDSKKKSTNIDDLLYDACKMSNVDMVMYILNHIDKIDYNKRFNIFIKICTRGDPEIVVAFLEKFDDIEITLSILNSAIASKNIKVLEVLVEYGANINEHINSLLLNSMREDCVDIVEYLLENGVNIAVAEIENILDCMNNNSIGTVELLLNKLDYNQEQIDYLFGQSEKCNVEMIKLLIKNGANLKKYGKIVCEKAKKSKNNHLTEYLERKLK